MDSVICPKRITDFDHSIEFHGQIVSISCTKDDLQMFVAVREWPENAVATRSDPPPISTEVIIHVVDLESWSLTGQVRPYPNANLNHMFCVNGMYASMIKHTSSIGRHILGSF